MADGYTSKSEASSDEEVQQSPVLPQLVELSPGADEDCEEVVLITGADGYTSDSEASSYEEDQPSLVSRRLEMLNPKTMNPKIGIPEINNGPSLP